MFDMNDRVITPQGPGKIAFKRMRSPDFNTVEAYSVILDSKVEASKLPPFPNVNGTIFPANEVKGET